MAENSLDPLSPEYLAFCAKRDDLMRRSGECRVWGNPDHRRPDLRNVVEANRCASCGRVYSLNAPYCSGCGSNPDPENIVVAVPKAEWDKLQPNLEKLAASPES